MLSILFTIVSITLAFQSHVAACDCGTCELNGVYNEGKGYGCFITNKEETICTCPDQRYEVGKRCRICDRKDICGTVAGTRCSEISPIFNFTQNNDGCNYACFCPDGTYNRCKPCSAPTTIPMTSTSTAPPTTQTQTFTTTTTSQAPTTTTTTTTTTTVPASG